MTKRLAAIDCGSNSTRLLVAETDGTAVERLMRITRLGQSVEVGRTVSGHDGCDEAGIGSHPQEVKSR